MSVSSYCLISARLACHISHNHWANEETMMDYVEKTLVPYTSNKRKLLKLPHDYPALMIFDHFSGQVKDAILQLLEENHLRYVMIPANCTDRLQPLDISVNKAAKEFLRRQFHDWYAKQICEHLKDDTPVRPVDLRLSVVEPIGAGADWMKRLYDYLKGKPEIIVNGFKGVGIVDYLASDWDKIERLHLYLHVQHYYDCTINNKIYYNSVSFFPLRIASVSTSWSIHVCVFFLEGSSSLACSEGHFISAGVSSCCAGG